MSDKAPDSQVSPHQRVEVGDTPDYDIPASGSVTVRMILNAQTSTALRMSRTTAASLHHQLGEYLGETK